MSSKKSDNNVNKTGRTLLDIELALAEEFRWLQNIIVFNVKGLSGRLNIQHESDMLILSKAGYLTEVEIKRSYADFCNEFKKKHHHESYGPNIKEFWYCVPENIFEKVLDKLTEHRWLPTGIIVYNEDLIFSYRRVTYCLSEEDFILAKEKSKDIHGFYRLGYFADRNIPEGAPRSALIQLYSLSVQPLFLEQQLEIARLGAMRQISLRKRIKKAENDKDNQENISDDPNARKPNSAVLKLRNKIIEQEILLKEYRRRFKEETGYTIDEKEVLYG